MDQRRLRSLELAAGLGGYVKESGRPGVAWMLMTGTIGAGGVAAHVMLAGVSRSSCANIDTDT